MAAGIAAALALVLAGACQEAPAPAERPEASVPASEPARGQTGTGPAVDPDVSSGRVAVAITVDDLPWVGPMPPGWDRGEGTGRIMAALDAHQAVATGFVNCGRMRPGAPIVRRWQDAGHELGNHTEQHLDLNYADPSAWSADARSCERSLRDLTGEAALPFRYPYLHRGPTESRYRAGRETLEALGSVIAPVTINTGDWILDDAYVEAVREGDRAKAEAISEAYLDHVARAAHHYREVARERLGRDVAHILLLHANALLADRLDSLLDRLEADGFRFVPLAEALRDPVYDLEDDYVGPAGLSWLYRIPPATPGADAWDQAEAAALRRVIR